MKTISPQQYQELPEEQKHLWQEAVSGMYSQHPVYTPVMIPLADVVQLVQAQISEFEKIKQWKDVYGYAPFAINLLTTLLHQLKNHNGNDK